MLMGFILISMTCGLAYMCAMWIQIETCIFNFVFFKLIVNYFCFSQASFNPTNDYIKNGLNATILGTHVIIRSYEIYKKYQRGNTEVAKVLGVLSVL